MSFYILFLMKLQMFGHDNENVQGVCRVILMIQWVI